MPKKRRAEEERHDEPHARAAPPFGQDRVERPGPEPDGQDRAEPWVEQQAHATRIAPSAGPVHEGNAATTSSRAPMFWPRPRPMRQAFSVRENGKFPGISRPRPLIGRAPCAGASSARSAQRRHQRRRTDRRHEQRRPDLDRLAVIAPRQEPRAEPEARARRQLRHDGPHERRRDPTLSEAKRNGTEAGRRSFQNVSDPLAE
jgi:hypothetical protein